MEERTLASMRRHIEALATAGGEYYVVCGRTGERPVPVSGLRFPDRETATEAVQFATAYRAQLGALDPEAPLYDFIACQGEEIGSPHPMRPAEQAASGRREGGT